MQEFLYQYFMNTSIFNYKKFPFIKLMTFSYLFDTYKKIKRYEIKTHVHLDCTSCVHFM